MRASLTVVCALLVSSFLACSGFGGPPKTYSFKNATGAEQHERLLWDAIKNKDRSAIESHLASNYVYQGEGGTRDKEQTLAQLAQLSLSDYSLGNLSVTPQGGDMIVTYEITLRGTRAGTPLSSAPIRFLSVWQEQSKGWMLIAQSEIPPR